MFWVQFEVQSIPYLSGALSTHSEQNILDTFTKLYAFEHIRY